MRSCTMASGISSSRIRIPTTIALNVYERLNQLPRSGRATGGGGVNGGGTGGTSLGCWSFMVVVVIAVMNGSSSGLVRL